MATLMFKVFALTLKTVSKPLASRFEGYVMNHPKFRQSIINFAQRLHRWEVAINRGAEGKTGRVFIGDMNEAAAVSLASKVASEGFVYAVGIGVVLLEIDRKRREDAVKKQKDEERRAEVRALHQQHLRAETELRASTSQLGAILQSMDERLKRLELAVQLAEEQRAEAAGAAAGAEPAS